MASSLVPQRVKNTGIDLLIGAALIGGAVLLIGYGNKKFNILGKFVSGVTSIGQSVGQAVGAGVSSIPAGIGQGAASVFATGGVSNNLSRSSLGLEPDTATCAHIPFTNIPIPGSQCSSTPKPQNTGQSTSQNAGLLPITPGEPLAAATQQYTISLANLIQAVPSSASRFVQRDTGLTFNLPSGGGIQPLGVGAGLTTTNQVSVGSVGLSQNQIQKDVALSKQIGGPVFDTRGNIVALNGVRLAR